MYLYNVMIMCRVREMRSNKLTLILITYFMMSSHAYAYLDPGTGSIILSSLIAALVATLVTVRNYWNAIKQFCVKKLSSKKKN